MIDPTFMIPDGLKQRFVDWLVKAVAGQAEKVGSDQAAHVIRQLSSDAVFRASADQALRTGIDRFIVEYREQDEDLVDDIVQDATFWESAQVQQALKDVVEHPGASMPDQARVIAGHFDTVLPLRLNRKRVNAAVSYLLGCIAQELWSLPGANQVREIYSLQFQKMTAEESREQTALMRQQLEATLAFNAEIRQAFLQLAGAMERNLLAAPALPALAVSSRPYNNLPQPTYVRFVGRDAELAWVRERLSPTDRAWQIAVTGIGGVGKTALALAVADEYRQRYGELPAEERFEAIVWVSAKEEVLTAQGRERADLPEAILHTLEDVYTAIARVLEREDITRALPNEQDALVRKALQRQRTLLVMDNMESVQDDRIITFLRRVPAPTKAIITTREYLEMADVYVLRGLSPDDAEKLIQAESAVRGVVLDAMQRKRLNDLTSGLPLPLKLGIARMSAGESFPAVVRWLGDAVGDLPEYCIKGQVDLARKRDKNAGAVLLACSLFDREAGASREALGEIANLSLADRDQALRHLWQLFLANRTAEDRFWVLPIVQRYAGAELSGPSGQEVIARWLQWLVRYVEPYGNMYVQGPDQLRLLGVEYPNLKSAIQWCLERELWDMVLKLSEGTWAYPYYTALLSDLDEILVAWFLAAREARAVRYEGNALLQAARLAWIRRQSAKTLEYLDEAEGLLEKFEDHLGLAEAWDTRSQVYEDSGMFDEAEDLAVRTLRLGERLNAPAIRSQGAERLASYYAHRNQYDQSDQWLDRAEVDARLSGLQRLITMVNVQRARNLMAQGDHAEAETLAIQCLEDDIAMGGRRYLAFDKLRLAEIYAATGRLQAARDFAEEARDLFERIGMDHGLQRAERFLEHLTKPLVEEEGL